MSESDAQRSQPAKPAKQRRKLATVWRAAIEIGFIVFLFYSNLLMGEFTRARGGGMTLAAALRDLCTIPIFEIGLVCALIGFVVVEYLRQKI